MVAPRLATGVLTTAVVLAETETFARAWRWGGPIRVRESAAEDDRVARPTRGGGAGGCVDRMSDD